MPLRSVVGGLRFWSTDTATTAASEKNSTTLNKQDGNSTNLAAANLQMVDADDDMIDIQITSEVPVMARLIVSEMEDTIMISHSPATTVDVYWCLENKDDCPRLLLWKDFPIAALKAASSTFAEMLDHVAHNTPLLLTGAPKSDIKTVLKWITASVAELPVPEVPIPKRMPIYRSHTLHRTATDFHIDPLADLARKRMDTILSDQAGTTDVELAYTHEPARFLREPIVKSIGEAWWAGRIRNKSEYTILCAEYPEFEKDMAAWWEKRRQLPK